MTSLGLNIGLKSLLTAQAALDTIGNNIANANTPGYSRQNLQVSTSPGLRLRGLIQGTGVQADVIQRTVDSLLQARLVKQTSTLSRLDSRMSAMSEAEAFLGTSAGTGVAALLQQFFDGISTLSTAPEDSVLRTGAVQSAAELAERLTNLSGNAETLRRDTIQRLEANVDQVNELARRLGTLNRQISDTEVGNAGANELRDRRDEALRRLSGLVDIKAIENDRGAVRVLVGGFILVSPTTVEQMQFVNDPASGEPEIRISGSPKPVPVTGGAIGGLFDVLQDFLPDLGQDMNQFARNLILETNRVHSTGIGARGPYRMLSGTNALEDINGSGSVLDELLSNSGLPFDVVDGELYVNVTEETTGAVTKNRIAIDASRTTVGDLVNELNAIDNVSAGIDSKGRLQVFADKGWGFDFSPRLDPNPDALGSFGGGVASLATPAGGPFALSPGDTLDLVGPLGAFTVTFNAGSFAQIGQATADEISAALNADPNVQAAGLKASAVGGTLVLQTVGAGALESFSVAGGSALGATGWTAGTTVTGQATAVDVAVSGEYTGSKNGVLTFRPNMDGTIGTTPGLKIQVFDELGVELAAIDVGPGYNPGDELDVIDGVRVSFGFGDLSASSGDLFALDVVADADTSDVLPALGVNGLFTGSDAATISVRDDILRDPDLLASSISGARSDGSNLIQLLALQSEGASGLGGASLPEGWTEVVGRVGLEISATSNAIESETFLLQSLEQRRDQISGVNVDEELVMLIEQEQAFTAASQYIRVISELTNELMNLI